MYIQLRVILELLMISNISLVIMNDSSSYCTEVINIHKLATLSFLSVITLMLQPYLDSYSSQIHDLIILYHSRSAQLTPTCLDLHSRINSLIITTDEAALGRKNLSSFLDHSRGDVLNDHICKCDVEPSDQVGAFIYSSSWLYLLLLIIAILTCR